MNTNDLPFCALPALVADLRRGVPGAKNAILHGFEWWVKEESGEDTGYLGQAWIDFGHAVDLLGVNDHRDPEGYLRNTLTRTVKECKIAERKQSIAPPDSTNRSRRKEEKEEYRTLRRRAYRDQVEAGPRETPTGKPRRTPDAFIRSVLTGGEHDIREMIDALACTDEEADVLQLLSQGYSERAIAGKLSLPRSQVADMVARVAPRAKRLCFPD